MRRSSTTSPPMFRRPRRLPSPIGIELTELPPWNGDPSTVRRSGYTPPQLFAVPSLATPADIHRSTSTLTNSAQTDISIPDSVPLPPANTQPASASHSTNSPNDVAMDVITAQIQRALNVTDATSEIHEDEDTTHEIANDILTTQWHDHESLFRCVLGAPTVDVDELRRLIWAHGIPERPWMRAIAWKLLCGVLPPDRADWDAELAARRAEYWNLVSEYSLEPSACAPPGDHPLCSSANSRWKEHFKDLELRENIARDTNRALADVPTFKPLRDALSRLLFVHSKQCPAARYRQGMHELAAPFLLVFATAPFADAGDAEADAYFCYDCVAREMSTLYASNETLTQQVRELQALLRIKDPGLEKHLTTLGVDVRFFALRWLRLWLVHEFALEDMVRIWDSLLTAERTLPWLRYICVAMIIRIRDELLAGDFAGCMKLLLRYPACDIGKLLKIADHLRTSNVVIVRRVTR